MIRFIGFTIILISFLSYHVTVQEDFFGEGSEAQSPFFHVLFSISLDD